MHRFVTFLALLLVSVPFGISISGCGKKTSVEFCNASSGDAGVVVGQLNNIVLQPVVYGVSLNYGQIGSLSGPQGTDCKGSPVTPSHYTYGSRDQSIVDINPSTGALCAGTWNRNQNVIPDYTVCTAPTNPNPDKSMTYVTAEADGVTSNPIPVFTHPVVTSIVLSTGTPPDCSTEAGSNQTTNCCPLAVNNTVTSTTPYTGDACVSQGQTRQLIARVFSGTGTYNASAGTTTGSLSNISCQAGHLEFASQTSDIVTIDENGVATALHPGSTVITASVSNAGSSAGFFSTCPPTSIQLSVPNNEAATNITVGQNVNQPLVATVLDQNNTVLTGLTLEYVSTTPTTIPVSSSGVVTPAFPGGASITALCQPPSCNPYPFNQIGLFGNGKPLASKAIDISTPGSNSTLLYVASTNSRYLVPVDFTTTALGAPVQLPYAPNSMVISQDGSTIYMGSSTELMIFSATNNSLTAEDPKVPGTVLAISPDNSTVVIADTARQLIYLDTISTSSTSSIPSGSITTQYGGVGTHAQWTPDSQTVYITTQDVTGMPQLLVYSTFTGWNPVTPTVTPLDVAVVTPSIGAYLAGSETDAVSYCSSTTVSGQTTTNQFYPQADSVKVATDRVAATFDGKHVIGASASGSALSDLNLTLPTGPCPSTGGMQFSSGGTSTPFAQTTLSGITPTAITGVIPTSDAGFATNAASGTTPTAVAVTYTGTGGVLPVYTPSPTSAQGTLANVTLTNGATAPVAGAWSADNLTFFAGTSGDNDVHLLTRTAPGNPLTDTKTIAPQLPALSGGGNATPNLIVQRPRKTT